MKPMDITNNADWKTRFRIPVVGFSQVAKGNPDRGMVIANLSGIFQLHAWNVKTNDMTQVTDQPAGTVFGTISVDGRYIYYLQDEGGNEIGHFVRVPFEGGEPEDITPNLPDYSTFFIGQSDSGNKIGLTAATQEGIGLYIINVADDGSLDEPQQLYRSSALSFGPMLSYDGNYAIVATAERSTNTDLSLLGFDLNDDSTQQSVKMLQDEDGSISPVGFAPVSGDTRLVATTNITGFRRPLIWDVKTGDRTDIPLQGMDGDFSVWDWSPDGKRLLLCQFVEATYVLYIYDLEKSTLDRLDHPSGTFSGGYFMNNDEIYINLQNATTPPSLIALDAKTGEMLRTVWQPETPPESRPWKSVSFPSSGGQKIQAWLATPEGEGPYPTIVHIHGGPTAVMTESFSASAQTWLDHGFAWISVNYRGSTTFGRQFEHAIIGHPGELEVDDLNAAKDYLMREGIAQADALFLTGGSYGGYLTLQTLGKTPDGWAGGIAMVAIADWVIMYEDEAEMLRSYQRALFGGTPEEKSEQHRKSSPLTYADNIKAPILVIQGENDTRCPARQMREYEQKLLDGGKDIHVHWFDAGHGSRAMEQNIEQHELMLRWIYRVLG